MAGASPDPRIPRLPHWTQRNADHQRVALSGFLVAATMEQADRLSLQVADYLTSARAAPGCLRAEIWRSRSDPMRFAVFLRFRCRADYESHARRAQGSAWWRETEALSDALHLSPE